VLAAAAAAYFVTCLREACPASIERMVRWARHWLRKGEGQRARASAHDPQKIPLARFHAFPAAPFAKAAAADAHTRFLPLPAAAAAAAAHPACKALVFGEQAAVKGWAAVGLTTVQEREF